MLSAKRMSDGKTVHAYFERKENGPFRCLDCDEEVMHKSGNTRVNHFAHVNPFACEYAQGESDLHRQCKMEIYRCLLESLDVRDVELEKAFGSVRPDVFAKIRGVPVAIEVQISSLSVETIIRRTIDYHQRGIYVLWLLQWTPDLDKSRYAPRHWEKWVHACYFGRVYYWKQGLEVVEYSFEPSVKAVPKKTWYSETGKKITVGGYAQRSARFRAPVRGNILNLVRDFGPQLRYWWEGGGTRVPDAKLFTRKIKDSAHRFGQQF
jgi:competence protein CoiA